MSTAAAKAHERNENMWHRVKEDVKADWPIAAAEMSPDKDRYTCSHAAGVRHHNVCLTPIKKTRLSFVWCSLSQRW